MSSLFIGCSVVVKPENKSSLDREQKEEEYFLLRGT